MSWEEAWREGRTGWDAGAPAPPLLDYLQGRDGQGRRALVPGCGSGHDAFALAEAGWIAQGLDVAPSAAARFERLRADRSLSEAQAAIAIGDFFVWTPAHDYDLIWDYTFLCAIEPPRRPAWAEQMARLLAPGGELVTLLFPVDPDDPSPTTAEDDGPPYRLHPGWVAELLAPELEQLALIEAAHSHPGREGMEWVARWRRRREERS